MNPDELASIIIRVGAMNGNRIMTTVRLEIWTEGRGFSACGGVGVRAVEAVSHMLIRLTDNDSFRYAAR
ncbi:hypothetical protein KC325_g45 [Hortaea werneckii]|nr:hypothetical protein KC325_g45 [Hortaea werneckii]